MIDSWLRSLYSARSWVDDAVKSFNPVLFGSPMTRQGKFFTHSPATPNLRVLRVGPLSNSRFVESITPLVLNAAILNNLKDPSIRIVPWFPLDFTRE